MGKCAQSINSRMLGKGEKCTDVINVGSYIHQKNIQLKTGRKHGCSWQYIYTWSFQNINISHRYHHHHHHYHHHHHHYHHHHHQHHHYHHHHHQHHLHRRHRHHHRCCRRHDYTAATLLSLSKMNAAHCSCRIYNSMLESIQEFLSSKKCLNCPGNEHI